MVQSIPAMKGSPGKPVNTGCIEGWMKAGWSSEMSATFTGQAITERSSKRGNQSTELRKFEDGAAVENMRRDLMTGENPWNMERESRERLWSTAISNRTTREKVQDPTTPFPICECDGLRNSDKQRLGETHGRGGGMRKGSFPSSQLLGGSKRDMGENVLSSGRDPRFGNEATAFERVFRVA